MSSKGDLTVYEINYIEYFGESERHNSAYVVAADDYEAVEYARHLAKTFYTDEVDDEDDEDAGNEEEDEAEEVEEWRAYHPGGNCSVEFTSIWAKPYIYIEAAEGHDDVCLTLRAENDVPYVLAHRARRSVDMGD